LRETVGADLEVSEKTEPGSSPLARRCAIFSRHTQEKRGSRRGCEIGEAAEQCAAAPGPFGPGATLAVNCGGVDNFLGMISTAIVEATLWDTWGAPQGMPQRRVPMGVLRPIQERTELLVLDAGVRLPREGAHLPSPTAGTTA